MAIYTMVIEPISEPNVHSASIYTMVLTSWSTTWCKSQIWSAILHHVVTDKTGRAETTLHLFTKVVRLSFYM